MAQEAATEPGQKPEGQPEPPEPQEPPSSSGSPDEPKFDEEYVKKLRQEAAGYRTQLKEYQDREKTDTQKATERAEAAEKALAEREAKLLRFEVAAAKGLDPDWAPRLSGSTKEELEADADKLLKKVGPDRPNFDGGTRGGEPPAGDMDSMIRHAAGRG